MCVLDSQIHFYDHVKFINIYCCICLPLPLPQVARLRLCARGSATATSQVWLLLVAFRLLFLYVLNGSNSHLQYTQLYCICIYLQHCLYLRLSIASYTHKINSPGDPRPRPEPATCSQKRTGTRTRTRRELSPRNGLSSTCSRFA